MRLSPALLANPDETAAEVQQRERRGTTNAFQIIFRRLLVAATLATQSAGLYAEEKKTTSAVQSATSGQQAEEFDALSPLEKWQKSEEYTSTINAMEGAVEELNSNDWPTRE